MVGYFTLHFDPIVLYKDVGVIPGVGMSFKKYRDVNNVMYIAFSFPNDTQEHYVHEYTTYISLLTKACFFNYDGTAMFTVTRSRVALGTVHIKVYRVTTNLTAHRVEFSFPHDNGADMGVLKTWNFDSKLSTRTNKLVPVNIIVPMRLWDQTMAYASSLAPGKFLMANVLNAALSFNSRTVITGASYGVDHPMDVDDLRLMVLSVFSLVFVKNWEVGKAFEELKSDIEEVRKKPSYITLMGRSILSAAKNVCGLVLDEIEDSTGAQLRDYYNYIRSAQPNYEIFMSRFEITTLQDEIPSYVAAVEQGVFRPYSVPSVSDIATYADPTTLQSLNENKVSFEPSYKPVVYDKQCECLSYYTRNVPGDGDCFYHSVIGLMNLKVILGVVWRASPNQPRLINRWRGPSKVQSRLYSSHPQKLTTVRNLYHVYLFLSGGTRSGLWSSQDGPNTCRGLTCLALHPF